MTHDGKIKILAFVGLSGSGKSTAVDYIAQKGYPKVNFGAVILDAMTEAGLAHTQENEKPFREQIRAKYGNDYVAKNIINQIHKLIESGQRRIAADGLYSWTEYKALKKEFPGELIVAAVVATKKLRHRRLLNRPIRPLSQFEADQRDWAEIENLEKGGPIAVADYYIMNNGSFDDLNNQIDKLLSEIKF